MTSTSSHHFQAPITFAGLPRDVVAFDGERNVTWHRCAPSLIVCRDAHVAAATSSQSSARKAPESLKNVAKREVSA